MTNQEKKEYYKRFSRFQQNREKMFAPLFNDALRAQYASVAANGFNYIDSISMEGIADVLRTLYIDAATVYGAKIRSDLNKQKARMPIGFSEQMRQLVESYFRTDILNTSSGITETTKDLIRKVFTDAYAEGLGIDDIIAKLRNTELSTVRARMIARTETMTAANQGAVFVGEQSGLKLNKEWLATMDNRTRRDHLSVDGQIVGMNDYFNVGGYQMAQPGDKGGVDGRLSVPAKEIVNCRCTLILNPIREGGKLVRV